MDLASLKNTKGAVRKRRRVGRGRGSGLGHNAGRGSDGQNSRSGKKHPYRGFEGGQMPLHRRIPKRGFKNFNRKEYAVINLNVLEEKFSANEEVSPEILIQKKIVKTLKDGVKILGNGEITKPLTVKVHKISRAAKGKIERAGGKVEVI